MKAGLKGMKIGVIEHFYTKDSPADPDQVRGIESAIEVLKKLGAEVRTIQVSPLSLWTDCNRTIHASEAYAIHERDLQERPEDFAMLTRNRILAGAFVSSAKYIKAQQLRRALCKEMAEATRGLDAVITLSSLLLPCKIDDTARGAEDLRPAVPACVQRHRHTLHLGADRAVEERHAARHADRRARVRRADGLSHRARLLRGGGHHHHRRSEDAAAIGARRRGLQRRSSRRSRREPGSTPYRVDQPANE